MDDDDGDRRCACELAIGAVGTEVGGLGTGRTVERVVPDHADDGERHGSLGGDGYRTRCRGGGLLPGPGEALTDRGHRTPGHADKNEAGRIGIPTGRLCPGDVDRAAKVAQRPGLVGSGPIVRDDDHRAPGGHRSGQRGVEHLAARPSGEHHNEGMRPARGRAVDVE